MTDFDTFYEELTSDEIWFESIKMTHPGKDWCLAAKQIFTSYLADKFIPEMKEVRKHLNNKLIYQLPKPTRIETNYQHEKKEDNFTNPLTEEQKKEVDKLLEKYKVQISQIEAKRIPKLRPGEAEIEGQWEKPKAYKHPSLHHSLVVEKYLHDEWIKNNFDAYTMKPKPGFIEEQEWLDSLTEEEVSSICRKRIGK